MGDVPFNLGEIHSIGPNTRERMVGAVQAPAMTRYGLGLVGCSEARRGFQFICRQRPLSQLLACYQGWGEVWTEGRWVKLRPGEAYITPARVPSAYRAASPGIWRVYWATYPDRYASAFAFPVRTPIVMPIEIEPLRLAIEGFCSTAGRQTAETEIELWAQLVHHQVRRAIGMKSLPDTRLLQLWAVVNNDLAHPWTLDELARQAALSREALRRLCLRTCGHSPLREVSRLRMQRAADLLLHTRDKVAAIAARVGFNDPFAFSTAFKRTLGLTPKAYRQQRA